jgi:hypothetical protein
MTMKKLSMRRILDEAPNLKMLKGGLGPPITIEVEFNDDPGDFKHAQSYAHGLKLQLTDYMTKHNPLKHLPMANQHGVRQVFPNEQDQEVRVMEVSGQKKDIEQWLEEYYFPYFLGRPVDADEIAKFIKMQLVQ